MTDINTSAEAIERDIEQTQNNISDTVEQLQKRLNPRSLIDAVLGDDDQSAQRMLNAARENPVAVGLLGLGALLLASGKSPSISGLGALRSKSSSSSTSAPGASDKRQSWMGSSRDDHHTSYVSHMAKVDYRDGEDDAAYQRRRDFARADYFMIDRHHDEDDSGFRARLNAAQESLRSRTSAFADKARRASHDASDSLGQAKSAFAAKSGEAFDTASEWSRGASDKVAQQYSSNPAIGGLVAAALGAAFGAALPATEIERRKLGTIGEQARSTIADQRDKAVDMLTEQKDKVVEKAHAALENDTSETGQQPVGGASAMSGVTTTQA